MITEGMMLFAAGWGLRLENKAASLAKAQEASEVLAASQHKDLNDRLDRIENKLDRVIERR